MVVIRFNPKKPPSDQKNLEIFAPLSVKREDEILNFILQFSVVNKYPFLLRLLQPLIL